jgi:hypothetical protein
MTIGSGEDLKWIKPVTPEADVAGDHRGRFEGLNVRSPQPGWHYYWERRQASDILRRTMDGFVVVQGDDPEKFGAKLPEGIGLPQDGVRAYGDVVLMKCPEDQYRELQAERLANAKAAREATTTAFLEKGHDVEQELGPHRTQGREPYYKNIGHGDTVEER